METIVINTGPLNSYNSLVYYISPKLKRVRELYLSGSTPQIMLDMTHIDAGGISISALTAFLTTCKKLRDYLGYPIPASLKWDPQLQGFLADLDFFKIADRFKLFQWVPEGIIGGYKMGIINPNSKLLYYADVKPIKNMNIENIGIEKANLKQKIAPNFLMRCASLFQGFDDKISEIISNTTLELIVNSLMHAEDVAFVGLQRTKKRITVAVCDGGIGFTKALTRTYKQIPYFKDLTTAEAIVIGSLIQKNIHGLRLAINEVLNYNQENISMDLNEGWVIISSFNAEIRWQKKNWARAIAEIDSTNIYRTKPNIDSILRQPLKEYVERNVVNEGYWRHYEHFLVGTRITFEIQLPY